MPRTRGEHAIRTRAGERGSITSLLPRETLDRDAHGKATVGDYLRRQIAARCLGAGERPVRSETLDTGRPDRRRGRSVARTRRDPLEPPARAIVAPLAPQRPAPRNTRDRRRLPARRDRGRPEAIRKAVTGDDVSLQGLERGAVGPSPTSSTRSPRQRRRHERDSAPRSGTRRKTQRQRPCSCQVMWRRDRAGSGRSGARIGRGRGPRRTPHRFRFAPRSGSQNASLRRSSAARSNAPQACEPRTSPPGYGSSATPWRPVGTRRVGEPAYPAAGERMRFPKRTCYGLVRRARAIPTRGTPFGRAEPVLPPRRCRSVRRFLLRWSVSRGPKPFASPHRRLVAARFRFRRRAAAEIAGNRPPGWSAASAGRSSRSASTDSPRCSRRRRAAPELATRDTHRKVSQAPAVRRVHGRKGAETSRRRPPRPRPGLGRRTPARPAVRPQATATIAARRHPHKPRGWGAAANPAMGIGGAGSGSFLRPKTETRAVRRSFGVAQRRPRGAWRAKRPLARAVADPASRPPGSIKRRRWSTSSRWSGHRTTPPGGAPGARRAPRS